MGVVGAVLAVTAVGVVRAVCSVRVVCAARALRGGAETDRARACGAPAGASRLCALCTRPSAMTQASSVVASTVRAAAFLARAQCAVEDVGGTAKTVMHQPARGVVKERRRKIETGEGSVRGVDLVFGRLGNGYL